MAGQIALVPGSMALLNEGGARAQARLALRHVDRVLRAMQSPNGQQTPLLNISNNAASVVCYVTRVEFIESAKLELELYLNQEIDTEGAHSQLNSFDGLVEYVVMPDLPRGALVEWQVLAINGHFDRVRTCTIPAHGEHVTAECTCTLRQTAEDEPKVSLNLVCRAGTRSL